MINILSNALELGFKIPNSDYNDALENGPLHGSGAYNLDGSGDRIAIPIHEARSQTNSNNSKAATPSSKPKKGVPSYLSN